MIQKNDLMIMLIILSGLINIYTISQHNKEVEQIKASYKKEYNALKKEYDWKTDRLRVYTDIIYRND